MYEQGGLFLKASFLCNMKFVLSPLMPVFWFLFLAVFKCDGGLGLVLQ